MKNRTSVERSNGMVWLPGGSYRMGSEAYYPEESTTRLVRVDPFWIDPYPVTNAQFAEFVSATGYRTFAEMPPDPKAYPGLDPRLAAPGSLVFRMPEGPVLLGDWTNWWEFCLGADWRHPSGPETSTEEIMDHPLVHVNYEDALAYANWKRKSLPRKQSGNLPRVEGAMTVRNTCGEIHSFQKDRSAFRMTSIGENKITVRLTSGANCRFC